MGAARTPSDYYPGADLGLPETGAGSIASMGRRLGAIFIDWLLCTFIVVAIIRPARPNVEYWTLLVFAGQDYLLTALTGFTIGKRLLRIRVVRLNGSDGRPALGPAADGPAADRNPDVADEPGLARPA